ncbi:MAG: hypothetical protein U9Q94_06765 [Candidatus Bipolaricaulota bacterium]|nr:hypothetical protein [Candidatus Bipolaricaulota bacterium]
MRRGFVVVTLLVGLLAVMAVSSFAQTAPRTDAWVPGLASFIIPGLGQLLNDQMDKAIIHFGVAVGISVGGSLISSALLYNGFWYGYSVVAAAYLVWSAYSGLDAYNVAKDQGFTLGMTEDGLTLSYNF